MFTKFSLKDYNFKLLFLVVAAVTIGIVFVNSANSSLTTKHIIGAVAGLIAMLFISVIDYRFICKFYGKINCQR